MTAPSRILIEHQCPQCGAPATLEETDRMFTCPFCRVKSYLTSRDFFRYLLPHTPRAGEEVVYLPYWRLKGILFSSTTTGVKHKIVDASYQAVTSPHFPVSLGLRSQTLKLRFVSPETEGRFLKSSVPVRQMKASVEEWFLSALPKPVFEQALIGDALSQIYSPFYVTSHAVVDAVLNRPVSQDPSEDLDVANLPGGPPDWQIRFIPALCPDCGWDLEGERESLVLHCKNCKVLWQAGQGSFSRIRVAHLPGGNEGDLHLPFYRIEAAVTGMALRSFADLVRIANLPKVIQAGWEKTPFHFWFPAFKVRPDDMLRFARNLTLTQPRRELAEGLPGGTLHPVTLPVGGASDGLKIVLASFVKPPQTMLPRMREITIKPKAALLIYIPFQEEGTDFSQPDFQLRINKHLLRYAIHL
ncbi:MAG: hypothetical protein AB1512_14320 [Thermodesulfobacteriota bacterium]